MNAVQLLAIAYTPLRAYRLCLVMVLVKAVVRGTVWEPWSPLSVQPWSSFNGGWLYLPQIAFFSMVFK